MEKPNRDFYDALTTLTAIGVVTETIQLGTGSLIPSRHPLVTALMTGTISQMVGPHRLILGFGAGTFDHEFEAIAWGHHDRVEMVRSNAEILRRVFTEKHVDYSDDIFSFSDISIEPKPQGGRIPFWYCGATPRSARLAVEFCDGWMPGRISLATMAKRIDTMRTLSEEQGKKLPTIAVIPPTSIEETRTEALKYVNIPGLLAWANKARFVVKPPSGTFDRGGPRRSVDRRKPRGSSRGAQEVRSPGCRAPGVRLPVQVRPPVDQIELLGSEVMPKFR